MNIFRKIYRKYFQTKKSKLKELLQIWADTIRFEKGDGSIFGYTSNNKFYVVLMYKTFSLELIYDKITDATHCLLNNAEALDQNPDLFEILVLKNGKEVLPHKNQREDYFPDLESNSDDYYPLDEDDF